MPKSRTSTCVNISFFTARTIISESSGEYFILLSNRFATASESQFLSCGRKIFSEHSRVISMLFSSAFFLTWKMDLAMVSLRLCLSFLIWMILCSMRDADMKLSVRNFILRSDCSTARMQVICSSFVSVCSRSRSIKGVQGRYYIPLLLPLFLVFYTDKIYTKWKEENYNLVMYLIVLLILHLALYSRFLIPYCS